MDKKNPLLAGLLNMLVPGLGFWYVNRDRGLFLKALVIGVAAIAVMVLIGIAFQKTAGFPLPQGVCVGIMVLIVLIPLFQKGHKAAVRHNFMLDNATQFTARQHGNNAAQLVRNQQLRDKGYISEQEYDSRKDSIASSHNKDEKPQT